MRAPAHQVENVVQGKCVTSVCWLKFQHTLAACPEFWPNITMIGPNSWGSDSGEVCSGNCALHFASFYKDEVCMEWLDDMTLCDRWRLRPPLHGGCQPKPHMREDMEHLSAHCIEQAEKEDILDMFIFIVVLGLFAALCGPCSFYVSFHPVAERSPFCLTVAPRALCCDRPLHCSADAQVRKVGDGRYHAGARQS